PQGRKTRRPAGDAVHQSELGHQPQDREGTGPECADHPASRGRRGDRVSRREFITLLAGVTLASPPVAFAQPSAMPVVGYLDVVSSPSRWAAFNQGLAESGYVVGQNVAVEIRSAEGRYSRFPELAADLVRRRVSVIVAPGTTPAALAARAATTTIPIVFGV